MASTVYQIDIASNKYFLEDGTWGEYSGYKYAIIPLEIGKTYKVTLQCVTTIDQFRVAQADSDELGTANLPIVWFVDKPTDGYSFYFTARNNFLLCFGGTVTGNSVAIEEIEPLPTLQTLAGTTWKFNDKILLIGKPALFSVNFKILSGDYAVKDFIQLYILRYLYYKYPYGGGTANVKVCTPKSEWLYEEHKTIKIIDGEDATNEIFIDWMLSNATLVDAPTTATVITYNGETIATLEAGQTATVKTANTEVEHDIVITPVFPIEIAYGDIIATAEAGQTATIKCANTEADFDIVVSAKAEEDDSIVGTWTVNETVAPLNDKVRINCSGKFYYAKGEAGGISERSISYIGYPISSYTRNFFVIAYGTGGMGFNESLLATASNGFDTFQWLSRDGREECLTFTIESVEADKDSEEYQIILEWLKANATKQ